MEGLGIYIYTIIHVCVAHAGLYKRSCFGVLQGSSRVCNQHENQRNIKGMETNMGGVSQHYRFRVKGLGLKV